MAQRKKTIIAGRLVKTVLYTAPEPRDEPRVRAAKSKATTAAQKAMNDKSALVRLELLLAANYSESDIFLTLTYRDETLPQRRNDAIKNARWYLRQLREQRKVRGQTLKYIYTTEDKHGGGRLHHHIVLNATGKDMETLRSLWVHGEIEVEYIGKYDYAQLARYLTKESREGRPVGAQMWTASRNLEKPIVRTEFVSNDTALAAPVGCHVLEREEKMNEFGSYRYIKYMLPHWYSQDAARIQNAGRAARRAAYSLEREYIFREVQGEI